MQYHAYELAHACFAPLRAQSEWLKYSAESPLSPLFYTPLGRTLAAACDVFESITRRYGKPGWGIDSVEIDGRAVAVKPEVVTRRPFGQLLHFRRDPEAMAKRHDPRVLLVAPMSGHYATLLRGTVAAMLPEHEVYITDWRDARMVPLSKGPFDLDDYIDYVIDFLQVLGPGAHVVAVCQPSVPVIAAAALMAQDGDEAEPRSITLMGGPIDTRRNPTAPNKLATSRSLEWFEQGVISRVPLPHPGFMRRVYPGFVQLTGFMTMNLDRHAQAHADLYRHLVEGDGDSVEQHRKFYDEYLAVMDLSAEFYLQTVQTVFQEHALPRGRMRHRGRKVDLKAIRRPWLMTVEGENDDICGLGQTSAVHDLCANVPAARHVAYVQPGVGHYGVFNGRRWRNEIQPRVAEVIRKAEARA